MIKDGDYDNNVVDDDIRFILFTFKKQQTLCFYLYTFYVSEC